MEPRTVSDMDNFLKGIQKENPVFVQVLGMCPILAVSNSVTNALAMGLATTCVLVMSSTVISLLRKVIPKEVRLASFLLIIAALVTATEFIIKFISLKVHGELGAFIALIVVNCIILGRAEAYAFKNPVKDAFVDAVGMGVGFTFALFCMGTVREILGNGTFAGIRVLGDSFEPWVIMILPSGGFFTLAAWLLIFNWLRKRRKQQTSR